MDAVAPRRQRGGLMGIKPLGKLVREKDRRTRFFKDRDALIARLGLRLVINEAKIAAAARSQFLHRHHEDGTPRMTMAEYLERRDNNPFIRAARQFWGADWQPGD
jgi:hypothetical protein